ncbi:MULTISPECIES: helix-turn-helix domain-containing protein [Nostoc]|uniref:Helix-turn-helix domain-containing protein n=1 Tax=Nostoc paludosum FACHB-159 TaxID=2692908 RepID=A0ABR8K8Q8_9NOSO|nr:MULTISPECIES: helix-turn-helix domain-containing protein [Nostoc]MBD2678939.1 helix-turn-helix domain-containing protein [Nostoc sp. FACHB-857]MBD2735318.1 helix-turn-helix domain-containing protein [Nostoc paludosum FACHB-159]
MTRPSLIRNRRRGSILQQGTSLVQAARFLGVDQSTLYMALQRGQIPTTRRNGRTVVSQGALMDYRARTRPLL